MLKALTLPCAAALFLLAACVQHDYIGEKYVQTNPAEVRVYYDASRIPSGMRVIGTDRAKSDESTDSDQIVNDLIKKAASVGADAVLIEKTETVDTGASTSSNGQENTKTEWYTDANGVKHKRTVPDGTWSANSTTTISKSKVITAKFYRGENR